MTAWLGGLAFCQGQLLCWLNHPRQPHSTPQSSRIRALLTVPFILTATLLVQLCWVGHYDDIITCSLANLAQVKVTLTLILPIKVTSKAEAHRHAHGGSNATSDPNSGDSLKQTVAARCGKYRDEPNEVSNTVSFLP